MNGSRNGGGGGGWRSLPLEQLALISPQFALAVVQGAVIAPMQLSCKTSFPTSDPTTISRVSLEGGQGAIISQACLVVDVDYTIDQPNAFPGSIFKAQSDYYFAEQSGIQATLDITGSPRYPIASFPTPLRMLRDALRNRIAWSLNGAQSITMSFTATLPLPSSPTNVCFTFTMDQPVGTDRYTFMAPRDALIALAKCGIYPSHCRNASTAQADFATQSDAAAVANSGSGPCGRCGRSPCCC